MKRRQIKAHKRKIEIEVDAKVVQQKRRRVPLQLQAAKEADIKKLLRDGHIRKVNKVIDEMFIQRWS